MKRVMIWSGAVLLIFAAGVAITRADHVRRHGRGGLGPFGNVAHKLDLSDAQKSQIKTIWQGERPAIASLVREFGGENKQMDSATAKGNFNEGTVQAIAAKQAQTVAKFMVEKERLSSNIYTNVLTPDQRTKADELKAHWSARLDQIASRIEHAGN